jgi:hypothetical protein
LYCQDSGGGFQKRKVKGCDDDYDDVMMEVVVVVTRKGKQCQSCQVFYLNFVRAGITG